MFYIKLLFKISIYKTIYYSFLYKAKVIVGRDCKLRFSKSARLVPMDSNSSIYIGIHMNGTGTTVVELKDNSRLRFGKSVCINHGCKVVVGQNAKLIIGNKTYLNEGVKLYCMKGIVIGNDCAFAWGVTIIDSDMHSIYKDSDRINYDLKITIGNKVWVGTNSIILKGVCLPNNVIISAGSTITKSIKNSNFIYTSKGVEVKRFDRWG